MRKRTRRKVWSTPAIPIVFGMTQAGLNKCRLLGAAAIESIAKGEGTDDHIAQVKQIADYCLMLCDRLARDGTVAEPEQLAAAREVSEHALETIAAMQAAFAARGAVACRSDDHRDLIELLDTNDALDSVATRRQARDVMVEMIQSLCAAFKPGEQHAISQQA